MMNRRSFLQVGAAGLALGTAAADAKVALEKKYQQEKAEKAIAKQEIIEKALDEDIEIQKVKYFVTLVDDDTTKNAKTKKHINLNCFIIIIDL